MNAVHIGLISDTHGLLRPEALSALQGSDLIIHAGDIGNQQVLDQLSAIAPVRAVAGNNDKGAWAEHLPASVTLEVGKAVLYVLHDLKQLDIDPHAAGIQVVIAGHSHRPGIESKDGVLYINPGSAGPRRFRLPVTLASLEIANGRPHAEILPLLP